MVTENSAGGWLGQQVGQHLDYDHAYGQQCFDFFNFYYQYITGEGPYANGYAVEGAKDIWGVPTNLFDKIPDSSSLVPNVGDVLVYGSSWGAGYGHVEVCRWSDANGCHVIGENEHGNASEGVVEVYRSWGGMRGLIGVMRPKFAPEPLPTPPQEVPVEPIPEPTPTPDPIPVEPSEPETPPVEETPTDPTSPVETPTPDPTPTEPPKEPETPTPPKPVNPTQMCCTSSTPFGNYLLQH
jgi:hypothetical protein